MKKSLLIMPASLIFHNIESNVSQILLLRPQRLLFYADFWWNMSGDSANITNLIAIL